MFFLYTSPVIQADATGLFLLALLLSPFVIPPLVKKAKISEAEEIKSRYPDGFKKIIGYLGYSIDYHKAKEIINKRSEIVYAQSEYEEQKQKEAEERRIKEKAREIRRICPHATQGKSDDYIVYYEIKIRQEEKRYLEQEARARQIIKDNPLGIKAINGSSYSSESLNDSLIKKIIDNESAIHVKQKECEANEAELKRLMPQLNELKKRYPMAVVMICYRNKWSISNAEHVNRLLAESESLPQLQHEQEERLLDNESMLGKIVKKAKDYAAQENKIRAKKRLSLDFGERVAEKVMEIIEDDEKFQAFSKHLDLIEASQNSFAQETRSIFPSILEGWGWYKYQFTMEYMGEKTNDSHFKSNTLTVWQAFYQSCCFDDAISYEFYPHYKNNRSIRKRLKEDSYYNSNVWDKVISFISRIKAKYGNELFVIFANTDKLDGQAFHHNYGYIEGKLKSAGIQCGYSILSGEVDSSNRKYVVIDIITENTQIKHYCWALFHYRHIMQLGIHQGTTGIVYISMLKCFDGAEVEELNKKKIKEREEELRKAREEEERRLRDERTVSEANRIAVLYPIGFKRFFPDITSGSISASQARIIVNKKEELFGYERTLSRLKSSVSGWDTVRGIPHYFFYYYYPTRFTTVSADSQEARKLVYNFKDGYLHNRVKDLVVSKIRNTFDPTCISKLCFVCIPASTRAVHQSRYKEFSQEVAQALGMSNAYDHITITREKTPSHLGGTNVAEYSYDSSFFNGKLVVLFDDIVTRGDSLSSMKQELERLGASVICAISIGRTYSDWNGNTPKPHPYTGRL